MNEVLINFFNALIFLAGWLMIVNLTFWAASKGWSSGRTQQVINVNLKGLWDGKKDKS